MQDHKWYRQLRTMLAFNAYGLLSLPLGLAELIFPAFGKASTAKRWQLKAATHLLPTPGPVSPAKQRTETAQTFMHGLASLPANAVVFAVMAPVWGVFITRGFLYPFFGADNLEQSWGGPTLVGAWIAHFIQGPPLVILASLIVWPLVKWQARMVASHFGAARQ